MDIRVCEGVHNCDVQILLNFKCTFHAAEGVTARSRLVRQFDGNSFVSVAHDEALIEGLDLDDNKYYTFNVNLNDGTGTVRNCIVFGNECGQDNVTGSPYFPSYAPMVSGDVKLVGEGVKTEDFDYNCYTSVTATAYGEHDILADPKFRIRKGRRYCLSSGSPCIEAAAPCAWMEEPGAADFYGNPRRCNAKPDISCVESQVGGFQLLVR